ncbi:LLM class flavin-dependent oxidoreductase [Asanoa iriomotensis]|uniref:LLM class F420-dependent oxidoreductase n=1 Tax=Asanoa iriomotensis TaxID=234613 RepID=A0ABQ4C1V3_9ACTN|nr:LLM class flavin-dependent oxidoreductase [Asanoa iriomotensis]GIF56411.1 LLM class F420-dependent oxidoreductase [Asanoa iriomotensis]
MRLAVNLSHVDAVEQAQEAEQLGYDVAFAPEGYVTDAVSVLGYVAARTTRIHLAAGVCEIPARSPAMTATTAATLDLLSGGRFRLGLGVANSYFSESWHGTPFTAPLARTREYFEVVRLALRREPVRYQGNHFSLPRPGDEPFRIHLPGGDREIPIYLAAVGPRNLELAGEIADGWIGVFCTAPFVADAVRLIGKGRANAGRDMNGFDVVVSVPVLVADDPRAAADPIRGYVARFIGLGAPEQNVYYAHLRRLGYQTDADEVLARVRAGDLRGAAARVPFEFVDEISLIGPPQRIARRMAAYAEAGVTTLALSPFAADPMARRIALRVAATVVDQRPDPGLEAQPPAAATESHRKETPGWPVPTSVS